MATIYLPEYVHSATEEIYLSMTHENCVAALTTKNTLSSQRNNQSTRYHLHVNVNKKLYTELNTPQSHSLLMKQQDQ
jgi:hypothetical protein